MTPLPRYAILIDGAFAIRKLASRCRAFRPPLTSRPLLPRLQNTIVCAASPEFASISIIDLRIGLDIARLTLTHSVEAIVVVTGDSDLVPAFKFAGREGVRVFLCHLGHGIKRELRVHADRIIRLDLSAMRVVQNRIEETA